MMTTETSNVDPVVLGEQASRIRNDPAVQAAFKLAHERIVGEWEHASEIGARERAHAKLLALKELLLGFEELISDGAIEKAGREGNPRVWNTDGPLRRNDAVR